LDLDEYGVIKWAGSIHPDCPLLLTAKERVIDSILYLFNPEDDSSVEVLVKLIDRFEEEIEAKTGQPWKPVSLEKMMVGITYWICDENGVIGQGVVNIFGTLVIDERKTPRNFGTATMCAAITAPSIPSTN